MTRTWTGYTDETRRYTLALRKDGELYSGGRMSLYSKCMRSCADKRRSCPDLNDYDPTMDKAVARLSESDKSRIAHLVSKTDKRRNRK